jgi:hypothetical protein
MVGTRTRMTAGMWRLAGLGAALALLLTLAGAAPAAANHPVMVEGNCDSPMPGTTMVTPGSCGDFDGDGRIGTAEDEDGPDRIFGTITAALGAGMFGMTATGANQNGRVVIVTSGRFPEQVMITAANGNVILEAAPGVDANIDAVVQGIDGNAARQGQSGIIINAPANRYVTVRNVTVRNWATGIEVKGASRATLEDVRLDSNVAYGILAGDTARLVVANSQVNASGLRTAPMVDNMARPGIGIGFEGQSSGLVAFTTVTGSVAAGIANATGHAGAVTVQNVVLFDNNPNLMGITG